MNGLAAVYGEYLGALEQVSLLRAEAIVCKAIHFGHTPDDIYLEVLRPGLLEMGRLWQAGSVSLSQSSAAGIITQQIMDFMAPHFDSPPSLADPPVLVLGTVPGEQHDIGLRMTADFFRRDGWRVIRVKGTEPSGSFLEAAVEEVPDLIALAATVSGSVHHAAAMIREARRARVSAPIAVGGFPFDALPDLWRRVGADLYAADPRLLVAAGNNIAAERRAAAIREPLREPVAVA